MPAKPSEDARAREYRRMMLARETNAKRAEKHTLAGDPAAARELKENWEPIVNRDEGWDPPCERGDAV